MDVTLTDRHKNRTNSETPLKDNLFPMRREMTAEDEIQKKFRQISNAKTRFQQGIDGAKKGIWQEPERGRSRADIPASGGLQMPGDLMGDALAMAEAQEIPAYRSSAEWAIPWGFPRGKKEEKNEE